VKSTGDGSRPAAALPLLRPIGRDCCQQRNRYGTW
jgi:hypothetical protein